MHDAVVINVEVSSYNMKWEIEGLMFHSFFGGREGLPMSLYIHIHTLINMIAI